MAGGGCGGARRPLTRAWVVACPSVGGARATAGPYRRQMAVIPRIEDLADPTFDPYLSDEAVFGSVARPVPPYRGAPG